MPYRTRRTVQRASRKKAGHRLVEIEVEEGNGRRYTHGSLPATNPDLSFNPFDDGRGGFCRIRSMLRSRKRSPTRNEPHDPNRTTNLPSVAADSLDAGVIGALDRPADPLGTTDHAPSR